MKTLLITALATTQLAAARPALATGFTTLAEQQAGAFGGVRVRLPLDGPRSRQRIRAGLTLAPTLHSRTMQGDSRLRIGEGLELGAAGRERVSLSLAGTPVSRLTEGGRRPDGERLGVSPLGWVAIGTGIVAVGAAVWFYATITDDDRCCE